MQKNYSQTERYVRGIQRNIKGNLVAGVIIIFVMIIVHLLNGCEPVFPNDESLENKKLDTLRPDSLKEKTDINEWDTDTVVYHSDAKPGPHK